MRLLIIFKLIFGFLGLRAALFLGKNVLAGLFVGLVVGHILDTIATKKIREKRIRRKVKAQARKQFESEFISSLFLMFGHICGVDGVIAKSETEEVSKIMTDMLKLDKRSRTHAIEMFKSARTTKVPFQKSAVHYFEIYKDHPQILESTIQLFLNVAAADKVLNKAEEKLIHTAASVFGIDERSYQAMCAPYMRFTGTEHSSKNCDSSSSRTHTEESLPPAKLNHLENCYATLGCKESDSEEDIKKSYRKLVNEYHPDKIISKELPEDFIQFANLKFRSIKEAYDEIKAARGFR